MEYAWSMEPASAVCVCVYAHTRTKEGRKELSRRDTPHLLCTFLGPVKYTFKPQFLVRKMG